jgi:hypothetical protein
MRKEMLVENEGFTLCIWERRVLRPILELSAHRRRFAMERKGLAGKRIAGTSATEATTIL